MCCLLLYLDGSYVGLELLPSFTPAAGLGCIEAKSTFLGQRSQFVFALIKWLFQFGFVKVKCDPKNVF